MANTYFDKQKTDARAAMMFSKIISDNGKTAVVSVPGHDGKTYTVILRRSGSTMTAECLLKTSIGDKPCQSGDRLCYHSMAAMMVVASKSNVAVSIAKTAEAAARLSRISKASKFALARHNSDNAIFVVAKKVVK